MTAPAQGIRGWRFLRDGRRRCWRCNRGLVSHDSIVAGICGPCARELRGAAA